MATQTRSIRIREAPESGGTIGLNKLADKLKKYGISKSSLSRWASEGKFSVVKEPTFPGDTRLFDEKAAYRYIERNYTPHRDNAGRKSRRSRTIPQMQAERAVVNGNGIAQVPTNGHSHVAGMEERIVQGVGRASVSAAPIPTLITQEWVDRFYEEQTRRIGVSIGGGPKELKYKTKHNYDWVLRGRFIAQFPTVPLERGDGYPEARRKLLEFVHSLRHAVTGVELDDQTKLRFMSVLVGFFNWMKREYGYHVPDLSGSGLHKGRGRQAVPIFHEDIRAVLNTGVRNHAEYTIILLLAQTGARLGELCTIRPELLGDHWVYVWGKGTKANISGQRPLAIPDEAFKALKTHFKTYGELTWVNHYGDPKPLAGPIEAAGPWAIDRRDHETYQVRPLPGMVDSMGTNIRRMVKDAGVHQDGKVAHAFRRAYQGEFVRNGGSERFMRMIMGHFEVGDMNDLYTHASIEDMVEEARKYAPRRFLQEEAPQGELSLGIDENLGLLEDDEEDE